MAYISRRRDVDMRIARCCAALAMLASSRLLNPPQAALIERKSKSGIATPKPDMELIEARLKRAAEIAEEMKSELKKS
jgi:hypothetical protein